MRTMLGFLMGLVLCLSASTAYALPKIADVEFAVNHGDVKSPKIQLGSWLTRMHNINLQCVWDFAKQGGLVASSPIKLTGLDGQPCVLPKGYIVWTVAIDTVTATNGGGGGTIAVGTGLAANDIKTATGFASYTGVIAGIPVGTAAAAIKMTSEQNPTITIATAAMTAGKIVVIFELYPSL